MKHFDEMTAFLYLDGQLDRVQGAAVLSHANECAPCRALLAALEKEGRWLEESISEEDAVPDRFAGRAPQRRLPWGWMTVLGMAAGGIFTVWNGIVEPLEQQMSQAGFTGGNLMTMLFFSGAFWKGWANVLNFFEFLAASVFAVLVLALFEGLWRRRTAVGVLLVGLTLIFCAVPSAWAGVLQHGKPNYTLPAGQTVNTDLFVAGADTRIDGTVNGDLFVWSRQVQINGHVTGDIFSWCQQLKINGQVDGSVRDWSQSIVISGTVAKNVLAASQEVELDPKGQVGGSLTYGGGYAHLSGHIGRDLMASTDTTMINGTVGGNAELRGGYLHIGSQAQIAGATEFKGRHKPTVDSGATLASPVAFTLLKRGPVYTSGRYYWHRALFWAAAFVFGLVLLFLLPGFFGEGVRASKRFLPALGLGALLMFGIPIIALLVCITVVGLGVGITALLVYLIALYAAQVFVGAWVGRALLGPGEGTGALLGQLALGLLILHALEMVPYHVGILVKLVVLWWGLGAIALAVYRHFKPAISAGA